MNDFQQIKQEIIAGNDTELKNAMIMADSAMETLYSMQEIDELYGTHIDGAKQAIENSDTSDTFVRSVKRRINNFLPNSIEKQLLSQSQDMKTNNDIAKAYFTFNVKKANDKHPSFELLNEKNIQPDVLQAVALYYLASEYEFNEKGAFIEAIAPIAFKVPDMRPVGTSYINSFREKAYTILNNATEIFSNKGHKKLAQLCKDVAVPVDSSSSELGMEKLSQEITYNHRSITREINAVLDPMGTREPPYTSDNEEWLSKVARCASLAEGNSASNSGNPTLTP